MGNTNENELIKQCLAGNRVAQKSLYDKYAKSMFGLCVRYSGNQDEAKDILQDGFVKVFTKLEQFSFQGAFEGWIKRVFINTALEYYRINKNHMYHSDVEAALNEPQEDFIIDKMSRKEILDAITQLSPGYRSVLNLYVIEGYSHAEIAEMLGITESTSKSQLLRARGQLKTLLNKLNKKQAHEK